MTAIVFVCVVMPVVAYNGSMEDPIFEAAFQHTLANEGTSLTNDPRDRGGLTAYGITQRSYSAYLKRPATGQDMAEITTEKARSFYYIMFWQPLRDRMPEAPATTMQALFDVAVHNGAPTAVALAQKAFGTLKIDGKLGPNTAALLTATAPQDFLQKFIPEVVARYARVCVANPTQMAFLDGWVSRAMRLWNLLPTPASAVA